MPSHTSGVEALARPTKVVEGLSAMPMISVRQGADGIRQQDLFGQTEGEQGYAFLDLRGAVAALIDVQLVGYVPGI